MIEINLIAQSKKFKMPIVLGVDLSVVNLKLVAVSIVIAWLAEGFYNDYFGSKRSEIESTLQGLNVELAELRDILQGNESVREELVTYNRQLERLRERSEQVRLIINQRTNPRPLLETISRNLPIDMWVDSIEISNDRRIVIKGGAESYSSIGTFVISANQANYFNDLSLMSSATQEISEGGVSRRVEVFEISGSIATYQDR
jgi:hypothetical protein